MVEAQVKGNVVSSAFDFGGYEFHPEVDMGVYVPLSKRCQIYDIPVVDNSVATRLDGSVVPVRSGCVQRQVFSWRSYLGFNARRKRGRVIRSVKTGLFIAP